MNMSKKFGFALRFVFAIFLIIGGVFFFIKNLKLIGILEEKPFDIVIANTSATETNIYWKNEKGVFSKIFYKKKNSNLPYVNVLGTSLYKDINTKDTIYEVNIKNLEPNTEYFFYVQTPNKVWYRFSEFKTKQIDEDIVLPDIKSGDSKVGSFVLVQTNKENIMVYTEQYENWALDLDQESFTVKEYGQYIPSMILKEQLRSNLLKIHSPVYAESGPNCKTNINRKDVSATMQMSVMMMFIAGLWKKESTQQCP
jgi:hypothetical protein